MKTFKNKLIAIAAVGILAVIGSLMNSDKAIAQGGPAVHIASPLPLPVKDADNPARSPFQALLCSPGCGGGGSGDPTTKVQVPPNVRLVLEYISGFCSTPSTNPLSVVTVDTVVGGAIQGHYPGPPEFRGTTAGGRNVYSFGQTVRLYADPGSNLTASASGISSSTGIGCDLHLSGHFIVP